VPSFVSVESRPYARSLAATLSSTVAEGSFSAEGLDTRVDEAMFTGCALLTFLGMGVDMPRGLLGLVWMDGSELFKRCIGKDKFGVREFGGPEGTIGGIEGGGRRSSL
jgi:hypothetical protein